MTDVIEVTSAPTTASPTVPHTKCMPWCYDDCEAWREPDGTTYHSTPFANVTVKDEASKDLTLDVSLSRLDERGQIGAPVVHLLGSSKGGFTEWESYMPPAGARRLAALLLNAADLGDPLPLRVTAVQASQLRLGDEVLTDAGWQIVRGLMVFESTDKVQVFTDKHNEEDTDGRPYALADSVKVRRGAHNGCQTPAGTTERVAMTSLGWCPNCRREQVISGRRSVSSTGVVRVRAGRCTVCGKGGKLNPVERTVENQAARMTAKAARVTS